MADKLSGSSGSDARHISDRKAEISALWDKLKVRSTYYKKGVGLAGSLCSCWRHVNNIVCFFVVCLCFVVVIVYQVKAANRKTQLDNAYLLHMFLGDSREVVSGLELLTAESVQLWATLQGWGRGILGFSPSRNCRNGGTIICM